MDDAEAEKGIHHGINVRANFGYPFLNAIKHFPRQKADRWLFFHKKTVSDRLILHDVSQRFMVRKHDHRKTPWLAEESSGIRFPLGMIFLKNTPFFVF